LNRKTTSLLLRLPLFDLLLAIYYKPQLSSRAEVLGCDIRINKPVTYFNKSSAINWSKYSCEKNSGTTDFYINIACERRLIQKSSTPHLTAKTSCCIDNENAFHKSKMYLRFE
jgi:hypothetical protein